MRQNKNRKSVISAAIETLEQRQMLSAGFYLTTYQMFDPNTGAQTGPIGYNLNIKGTNKADTIKLAVSESRQGISVRASIGGILYKHTFSAVGNVTPNVNININSGDGNDVVCVQDYTIGNGNPSVSVFAGKGDDKITSRATNGTPYIYGGPGNDKICVFGTGGEMPTIVNGDAGNDTITAFDGAPIYGDGGPGNDTITGDDGNDMLGGGPGNDLLTGGDGNNEFRAGSGQDTMVGGDDDDNYYRYDPQGGPAKTGVDTFDGGDGYNTIYYRTGDSFPTYVNVDQLVNMDNWDTTGKG